MAKRHRKGKAVVLEDRVRRQCTGKVRYSKSQAEHKAWNRDILRGEGESHIRAYKCPYCAHWHIGHVSPRVEQEDDRRQKWIDKQVNARVVEFLGLNKDTP